MNILKIFLVFLFAVSCSMVQESGKVQEVTDVKSEVDLFLSTQDPEVENRVLERLKSAQVSNETVKSLLRTRVKKSTGSVGIQKKLQYRHNGKDYPYALFLPESLRQDENIPLIVVLHGLGGSGANTIPAWVERLQKEFAVLLSLIHICRCRRRG